MSSRVFFFEEGLANVLKGSVTRHNKTMLLQDELCVYCGCDAVRRLKQWANWQINGKQDKVWRNIL